RRRAQGNQETKTTTMNPAYRIDDPSQILSPGLLFFKDLIAANLRRCLEMAGDPARLRPHVKTHKTREIVTLQLAAGVRKHKRATLAEAELLAGCGVPDVLLAYHLVGPNCGRMARLVERYPETQFSVLADHLRGLELLSAAVGGTGRTVDVLLDLDVGQHRTGVAPGPEAEALYRESGCRPGLRPGGL